MTTTPPPAPVVPETFSKRTPQGCLVEGRSHPNTGVWTAWVSKGEIRHYISAATHDDLLELSRLTAAKVHAEHQQLTADRKKLAALTQNRQRRLKQYPELVHPVSRLPKGFTGTVYRKPGGQPLWRARLEGPDGYLWAPKDTFGNEAGAVQATREQARSTYAAALARHRAEVKRQLEVDRALARAVQDDDLTAAGALAWDIVIRAAAAQGFALDSRNAPATTCCTAAPRGARDSSRIVHTDRALKTVLVRSVWWSHHSRAVHKSHIHTVLARLRDGQVELTLAPNNSRTVKGALAALVVAASHQPAKKP